MTERIAEHIAKQLVNLNFISKATGCVDTLLKPATDSNSRKLPAALVSNVYRNPLYPATPCTTGDYMEMTPDSDEVGIIFFEDMSSKATKAHSRRHEWKGTMRMVVWLNRKKIGYSTPTRDLVQKIVQDMPRVIPSDSTFLGAKAYVAGFDNKRPSALEKYDLDEVQTQYATFPYFTTSIIVNYIGHATVGCPTTITITPEIC